MGLVGHWPLFNDSKDIVGTVDGTDTSMTYSPGGLGECAVFNGTSSCINFGNNSKFDFTFHNFSIAFFAAPDTGGATNDRLFSRGVYESTGWEIFLGAGVITLRGYDGTSEADTSSFTDNGSLRHFVVRVENNYVYFDIDGVYDTVGAYHDNPISNTGSMYFGRYQGSAAYFYSGDLCDVRFYDHILSQKEVINLSRGEFLHWNFDEPEGPTVIDLTNHGNNGTINNATRDTNGLRNSGLLVNGSLERCRSSLWIKSFSAMTLTSWMYFNTVHGTGWRDLLQPLITSDIGRLHLSVGDNSFYWYGICDGGAHIGTSYVPVVDTLYFIALTFGGTTCRVWIDAVQRGSGTRTTDMASSYLTVGCDNEIPDVIFSDVRFFGTELDQTALSELYETRMSIDNKSNLFVPMLKEYPNVPLLPDWTTWIYNTTGHQTGFYCNGSTTESKIVYGSDPFGKTIKLWEALPDVASGADGGFYLQPAYYPEVDNTKLYRFSVWVKRVNGSGTNDGNFYLGTYGYDSVPTNVGVYNRSNGANNTNPYFYSALLTSYSDTWLLVVGHVWTVGSGTGRANPTTGVYDVDGKLFGVSDFVWRADSVATTIRTYLYYCTDTTVRQYWCYPRIDVIDGTEPTINDLLAGYESNAYEWLEDSDGDGKVSVGDNAITSIKEINEVGPTEGLVGWWKFDEKTGTTAKDSIGDNDCIITGCEWKEGLDKECGALDNYDGANTNYGTISGSGSLANITDEGNAFTMSIWFNSNGLPQQTYDGYPFFRQGYHNGFRQAKSNGWLAAVQWYDDNTLSTTPSTDYAPTVGTWYHLIMTIDSVANEKKFFVNATKIGSTYTLTKDIKTYTSDYKVLGYSGGTYIAYGQVCDARIYNRAITEAEINILYQLKSPNSTTKMIQSKEGILYTNNLIEV